MDDDLGSMCSQLSSALQLSSPGSVVWIRGGLY